MPVGRPTDYRPEYCELLVEHMNRGFSFESFAATINTCRATLYLWAQTHVAFSDAKKRGQDGRLLSTERQMEALINGESKGNPACLIFKLKNVERDLYGDVQTIKHEGNAESILSSLSPEVRDAVARDLLKAK